MSLAFLRSSIIFLVVADLVDVGTDGFQHLLPVRVDALPVVRVLSVLLYY